MKLTSTLFEAFLKCPTKCYLRSTGQTGAGNAYADWVREQNDAYLKEGVQRLAAAAGDGVAATTPGAAKLKTAAWRLAVDLPLETETMASRLHAVERVPSQGRGRPAQFIPVRFDFLNKLTKDDRLRVAFDALVLSEVLGREVSVGKIIHGDDHATLKVKVASLLETVRKLTAKMSAMLSAGSPPDLILNRQCGECEFRDGCRQKAVEKDDLSLLAGMSAKERQKLHSKGIFTVTQLSYTFRPRRRPKRLREKREKHHHSLKALAIREKKIHIVGTPELKIEGTPVYLDVEGLPDRDFYYLIGLRIGNGESAVQHSLWADTIADEGTIWREFLAILEGLKDPVLVHFGSYETLFLRRMCEHYGGPAEGTVAATAFRSTINLISVIFAQVYFPTWSNGLKEIADWLGWKWSEDHLSGLRAICWRMSWERTLWSTLQQRLIAYNVEDCTTLELVAQTLKKLKGLGEGKDISDNGVVRVDTTKIQTMWPKFSSPISEFEQINKAARWDYQRDRVYVRSSKVLKRLAKKNAVQGKWQSKVTGVVDYPVNPFCPRCGKMGYRSVREFRRTLYDVYLGRSSIRKRLAECRYPLFWCSSCRARFGHPKDFWQGSKFGRNLIAYIIYQLIELHIPMTVVKMHSNRLLQLGLTFGIIQDSKRRAAKFYTETRQSILSAITKGNLLHVDETHVSIRGKTGYVWVFTNLHEVAYLYTETREGGFLQDLLKDFRGVLVSDFYAAYEAMQCPQQRCLLHLMRDLNEEILNHPFDEGLKDIVRRFAPLLRPIVETVDRYGLKRQSLKRHRLSVNCFYRWLNESEFQSEVAVKCKARFEKNQCTLFTFLEHDGVPWNNNNAEHAIKAFAALRDVVKGSWTIDSVDDYLILLSLCETCKYMGVDFLDFLRSGEKDIHAFAETKRRRPRKTLGCPPITSVAAPGLKGSYWLDLFTATTWMEFRAAGARITGFRPRMRNTVAQIRKGDILLCYLTGVMRWVGALEVVGPSNDRSPIWTESAFPARIEVKPLIVLEPDHGVPMSEFAEKAPFYRDLASFKKFKGFLRGCPKRFKNRRNGEIILRMLYAAQQNPLSRAVDPKELAKTSRRKHPIDPANLPADEGTQN
jgi:predicted RecB family nuclease